MPILLQQVIIGDILARQKAESPDNGLEHEVEFGVGQLLIAPEVEDIEEDCFTRLLQWTL